METPNKKRNNLRDGLKLRDLPGEYLPLQKKRQQMKTKERQTVKIR